MSEQTARDHLARFGAEDRILSRPDSTATVELAAKTLGVEPPLIAKTLAIRVKGTERTMVVVMKGTARLDNAKFKAQFGGKASFLSGEDCQTATGHVPGGVCPFRLLPGIEVYLDETLRQIPTVYPAAGAPNNCVKLSPDQLALWSGGEWVDLCRDE